LNPLEVAFSLTGSVVVLLSALWWLRSHRATAAES
jgi:hypothetical protein